MTTKSKASFPKTTNQAIVRKAPVKAASTKKVPVAAGKTNLGQFTDVPSTAAKKKKKKPAVKASTGEQRIPTSSIPPEADAGYIAASTQAAESSLLPQRDETINSLAVVSLSVVTLREARAAFEQAHTRLQAAEQAHSEAVRYMNIQLATAQAINRIN